MRFSIWIVWLFRKSVRKKEKGDFDRNEKKRFVGEIIFLYYGSINCDYLCRSLHMEQIFLTGL